MSKIICQPSFSTVSKDEEYICPYDPVHRVSAKRFPMHLARCRKNHNAMGYVTCPFNARHEVPKPELEYHMLKCPDQDVIRQDFNPTSEFVPTSSNRPPTPPPTQGLEVDAEEDWECEAESEAFIPANAHKFEDEQKVDSYAVVQSCNEIIHELHGPSKAAPVDVSKMTPSQRKNYKRSLKRQQKRAEEGDEEQEPELTDQERIEELLKGHTVVMDGGGFVDYISTLNIHCQQNKINTPKYQEGPGVRGGFGYQVIIQTSIYKTAKYCKTKKEAKQNAALVAMLALAIQCDSGPVPNRKNIALTSNERERMRETHEHKSLLQASREPRPRQQQPQPALQPPSSFACTPPVRHENGDSSKMSDSVQEPMTNLSIQDPEEEGWTTVPSKSQGRGVTPVFDYSMRVAGRGRGRALR